MGATTHATDVKIANTPNPPTFQTVEEERLQARASVKPKIMLALIGRKEPPKDREGKLDAHPNVVDIVTVEATRFRFLANVYAGVRDKASDLKADTLVTEIATL